MVLHTNKYTFWYNKLNHRSREFWREGDSPANCLKTRPASSHIVVCKGALMTNEPTPLIIKLKNLGFSVGSRMRLYGEIFEMASEPIVVSNSLVLVDAIEIRSGEQKRIRIPLPILKVAGERAA